MSAETLAPTALKWKTYVAVATFLAILAGAAQANCAITGINVTEKPDRVVISVQGDCAMRMSPFFSPAGRYLGFQFTSRLAMKGRMVGIHGGGIYNVRYGIFRSRPPITRVVVNTTRRPDYATSWSDDKRRVDISVMKYGVKLVSAPKPLSRVKASVQQVGSAPEASEPSPELPAAIAPEVKTPAPAQPEAASVAAEPAPEPVRVAVAPVQVTPEPVREPVRDVVLASTELVFPSTKPVAVSAKPVQIARADSGFFGALASGGDPKVSVNFLNADINDVLKALSVQSGHNVVASKDVTGNVTVSLNRVSMDDAMDYVAKLSGYSYAKENGTYLVAAKNSINNLTGSGGDDSSVDVVAIQYTNADDLIALLATQCPGVKVSKANLQSLSAGNTKDNTPCSRLVLAGSSESVAAGKKLIEQVEDSMMTQTSGQKTEVYRVKYVKPCDLAAVISSLVPGITVGPAPTEGFDLSAPQAVDVTDYGASVKLAAASTAVQAAPAAGEGAGSNAFDAKKRYSAIVITGQAADVAKALEVANKLDFKAPQIKIDAKITSITETGEKKLGLTWDWDSLVMQEGSIVKNLTDAVTGKTFTSSAGDGKQYRQPFSFGATLEALITNGDGELLASPSLICLEGKPGVFFVGDEVTYIQRIETTPTGQNITTDTKQVGVQLRVSATTNPDDFITLNLHPEVSVLKLVSEQGMSLPIVSRRFTDHVVRVKSGETIVIGGLIRNDDLAEMSKVPGLSSIPLFGHLFRHNHTTREHTEVVMFITATAMKD